MDIIVKDIFKSFKDNKVLNVISLSINEGSIDGFIGKNGSGKTTFMKIWLF